MYSVYPLSLLYIHMYKYIQSLYNNAVTRRQNFSLVQWLWKICSSNDHNTFELFVPTLVIINIQQNMYMYVAYKK